MGDSPQLPGSRPADDPGFLAFRHAAASHVPTPVTGTAARPARPAPGSWDASPS